MNRDRDAPRHPAEDQPTGVANPTRENVTQQPIGQCEECGTTVLLTDAVTESYAGFDGRVTLVFCRECAR